MRTVPVGAVRVVPSRTTLASQHRSPGWRRRVSRHRLGAYRARVGELYIEFEYWITFTQLVMAMLAMGATLELHDFLAVIKLPKSFATGLVAQILLVPLTAYVLLELVELDPGVAVGLAILAAVPGG